MKNTKYDFDISLLKKNNDGLTKWLLKNKNNRLIHSILIWQLNHPTFYQFIAFNLLSNCATITNFVVLWLSSLLFFKNFTSPFNWWLFDYSKPASGGIGGFYSFVLSYICAQIVNYFVQRNVVFGASFGKWKLFWYIITVLFAGLVSVILPPYIIGCLTPYFHEFSVTIANIFNIIAQVIINWPMMKFIVMKN